MAPGAMEACREALLGGLEKILEKHHKRLASWRFQRINGFPRVNLGQSYGYGDFPRKIVDKWLIFHSFVIYVRLP